MAWRTHILAIHAEQFAAIRHSGHHGAQDFRHACERRAFVAELYAAERHIVLGIKRPLCMGSAQACAGRSQYRNAKHP